MRVRLTQVAGLEGNGGHSNTHLRLHQIHETVQLAGSTGQSDALNLYARGVLESVKVVRRLASRGWCVADGLRRRVTSGGRQGRLGRGVASSSSHSATVAVASRPRARSAVAQSTSFALATAWVRCHPPGTRHG